MPAAPEPVALDFSRALVQVRLGDKIARAGWNGKNMYVVYQPGYPKGIPINSNTARATGIAEGTVCIFEPYLMLYTTRKTFVPWVITQSDVLGLDWLVVD